jgi:hypothetical protein
MTAQLLAAIYENRPDTRLYFVSRNGRVVKKFWHQLDNAERAQQIEAEERESYCQLFNIY